MKRRTWLRLNVGPCSAHAYEMDRMMDDGLKKIYEEEEMKKLMEANTKHELEMMRQARQAEGPLFKDIDPHSGSDWNEKRMDIIGQNGNDGDHYELSDYEKKYGQDGTMANNMAIAGMYFNRDLNRGNWWGLADDWDTEEAWDESDEIEASKNEHPLYGDAYVHDVLSIESKTDEIEASKNEKTYKVDGRHPEPDATGMEEDPPSAAEDCARQRGNYEL